MQHSVQYTSEQNQIIAHAGGHARIIAVAGSGKTQTLTAYVENRLRHGANPRRMLVLMYNKAAQLDFEKRLRHLVGRNPVPDIRTFHSLGYRICQTLVKQGDMAPFHKNLLQDYELEPVVWRILRHLADESIAEDVLTRKKKWVEPAMAYFELVKSSLETPEIVFEGSGLPKSCHFFIEAFHRFEDWRGQQNKMTFADLIYEPVQRFKHEPHLIEKFAGHMEEIIVDEFQDINPVQQFLLETIHGGKGQVIVVGDPDQTIYEFRGSKPSLLTHHFSNTFTEVTDYQLSHTFRFGDALSLLANQVIATNYDSESRRTQCISHQSTSKTRVATLPIVDSAGAALQSILTWTETRPLADIAVINRLWANSAPLELLLLANSIPYRMDNQQTVLERFELRPFRVLLQIANGNAYQWDEKTKRNAWQSLLTQPYLKIKKTIVDQLIQQLAKKSSHWATELRNAVPESLSQYQSEALFERARIIAKAEHGQGDAYAVIRGWINSTDYLNGLKDNAFSSAQVDDQIATVKAFAQFVRHSKWTLAQGAFELAELAARKTPDDVDALLITSIHKSKGREWPCVIIPELNGRFFPYQPEGDMMIASSLASERRLLYVAMTRAQQELIMITSPATSDTPTSSLLPEVYVEGLSAFVDHLDKNSAELKLPVGMHKSSVEHYAQVKGIVEINWIGRKTTEGLTDVTVKHPTLGVGQILRESEKRLWIKFLREGKMREFDRAIVLPLLTIVQ